MTSFDSKFKSLINSIKQGTSNLTQIDFKECPLTKRHIHVLTDALGENFQITKNIKHIDLSFANIQELPIDIFRDCDGLMTLNLDNNKLHSLPALPDRPYALQEFFANNNPLKKIKNHYFKGCISLKAVYLSNTMLEEAPHFDDSLSLAWLHFNKNPLHCFPTRYFNHLDNLDILYINDTKLKSLPDLSKCNKLHEVWIDNIKIPDNHISTTAQIIICKTKD